MVAGVWTLFMVVSLVFERVLAAQEIGPDAYFSLTAEVTVLPMGIALAFVLVFISLYLAKPKNRLQHESLKFRWRSSVAILFCIGLIGGMKHYSTPMKEEVMRAWTWAYAVEMQQLSELRPKLENVSLLPDRIDVKEELLWGGNEPSKECNIVFISLAAIENLPNTHLFFGIPPDEHLWLKGRYTRNLQEIAATPKITGLLFSST